MVARETLIRNWLESLRLSAVPDEAPERLARLTEALETEGVSRGIIGPNESGRVLPRHVLESCALLPFVDFGGLVIDVGSGGGLPGLPLACVRAGPVTMIESQARRVAFVRRMIADLALGNAQILHLRAEDAARGELRESARTVVARALAPPTVALELCLPFASVGGTVLIPVGAAAPDPGGETRGPSPPSPAALARVSAELGGGDPRWERMAEARADPTGILGLHESRLVLVVPKVVPTDERYPRRAGVPSRRPLG